MRLHPFRLLIALVAVMALVAPIRPAIASAAPLDTAIASVEPAVVQIDTTIDYQHAIGAGTGFLLSPNGEVLTNFHVVQGADVVTAHNVGTGQSFGADLVGYDRTPWPGSSPPSWPVRSAPRPVPARHRPGFASTSACSW